MAARSSLISGFQIRVSFRYAISPTNETLQLSSPLGVFFQYLPQLIPPEFWHCLNFTLEVDFRHVSPNLVRLDPSL